MKNNTDLLGALGFIFPTNSDQLSDFETLYEDYEFEVNEKSINPKRILRRLSEEKDDLSKIDYHRRLTLAAEIVYQLIDDRYMGHLKLEKMLYLCKNLKNISIHTNFLKQAMGPHDPVMIRSFDKRFLISKWFRYNFNSFPKYTLLEKAGEHRTWFNRYFNNDLDDINYIIQTFKAFNGDQIELVVTIFDCWADIIEDDMEPSIGLISKKVYGWSENKAKFKPEQIENAISWMKQNGIFPKS
ncbi:hypothetical protein [Fulvivirga sp.]|uniref:hypothetical protein n=1 Tax=Fulvivirga sp. TaxID=1931237 RepID=UPI0032EF66A3